MLLTAWATVALIGNEMPEPEFRRLVDRSEALASLPPPDRPPSEFDELVMEALDDLPEQFRELLERTPVVVSNRGHEHHAYGHYIGGTVARDIYPDRIVIYQDTLERDFGHDPELLRAQVERTVRQAGAPPGLGRAGYAASASEPARRSDKLRRAWDRIAQGGTRTPEED